MEDHFARLNTALTRGKAVTKVAVIHPVEGFWLRYGPNDKTAAVRAEMEADFNNIINWLLFNQIDFDFVSESLLPDLYKKGQKFTVGQMDYDVVLVPNCLSMRATTLDALKNFNASGGKIIFAGEAAQVVDGVVSNIVEEFSQKCIRIPFAKTYVIDALEDFRDISIQNNDGSRAEHLLYQLRQDGEDRWLFICNGTKPHNEDIPSAEEFTITINGEYAPILYDTITGDIIPISAEYENGMTIIKKELHMHDSLLLKLESGVSTVSQAKKLSASNFVEIAAPYAFKLAEPNVLVLDMAEYAFNNEHWQAKDEILRVDNLFRKKLGYPMRMQSLAQPWTLTPAEASGNILSLRYTIDSEIALAEVFLALENVEGTEVIWNGSKIKSPAEGYYVDLSIHKLRLPGLNVGQNELILKISFEQRTNVENCFLLGEFGVDIAGSVATITKYPEALMFGDITRQGLPFYGGNLIYKCRVYSQGGNVKLEASYFRSPVLAVKVDGKDMGYIAYAPYIINLGNLTEGWHEVEITSYGNRINTFGTLHNADEKMHWVGPNAWRTEGHEWSYEYMLQASGVLKAPRVASS